MTGESLSPFFASGDFVLVLSRWAWLRAARPGDVLVFKHPRYGLLIKRLVRVQPDGLWLEGSHPASTDSRAFGPIPPKWVRGRVIWHIAA